MVRKLSIGTVLLTISGAVFAGPSDDAQTHFKAIAAGNVDTIVSTYGEGATLHWVGGPLNGTYTGADKIKEVWGKFAKNNAPAELTVTKVEESANPAGATVTAHVELKGKSMIKVRYVLVYRDGKLVNEVWQIDPKLM